MGLFFAVIAFIAGIFWLALGAYIGGNILLPELGLTSPEYWIWFKYMCVGAIFYTPVYIFNKVMD